MLTAYTIGNGCNRTLGAGDEITIPERFVDRYKYLELASEELVKAFTGLTAISSMIGGLTTELITRYNDAHNIIAPTIRRAIEERNALDGVTPMPAVLPPSGNVFAASLGFVPISTLTTTLPGVSPGFIPASRIRFVFEDGKTGNLGDAIGWLHDYHTNDYLVRQQVAQLGEFVLSTLGLIAIIAGVVFLGWMAQKIFSARYTSLASQEASRTDGQHALYQGQMLEAVVQTTQKLARQCIPKATNAAEVAKCIEAAGKAAAAAASAVPVPPNPVRQSTTPKKGRGFLEWAGILALSAVVLGGGLFLYKRRERVKGALQRTGKLSPARQSQHDEDGEDGEDEE